MKTNVSIELNDLQRNQLACLIDRKIVKRLATRKEVVALCEQHIAGLIEQASDPGISKPYPESKVYHDLYHVDPEDEALLKGKCAGYIRGWNSVKRGKQI
jgi:hypothetical protein